MKLADLKLGVEYAIIPAWEYSSQDKKNPDLVSRRHVAKARLVSLDKYEYEVYRSNVESDSAFKPAPSGTRSVGYKVVSDQWGQPETYWVSRPQDIVAPYADLETRWNKEEQEQKERELREAQEREERERVQREAREYQERVSVNLINALKTIIGNRVQHIETSMHNRRRDDGSYLPTAVMTLDLKTMELLVEKVLEARDLVS
jgi:hypothetical protein